MSFTFLDYFLTCLACREHLLLDVSRCPGRLRRVCNLISSSTSSICEIHVIKPESTIENLYGFLLARPNVKKKTTNPLDFSLDNSRRRLVARPRTNTLSTTIVPFRKQASLGKELLRRKTSLRRTHERPSSVHTMNLNNRFVHRRIPSSTGEIVKSPYSERVVVILHSLEKASKEYQSSLLELLTTRRMEINGKLYPLAPWFIFVVSISKPIGKIKRLLPRLRSRFLLQVRMEKNTEIGNENQVRYTPQDISGFSKGVEGVHMDMSIEQYIRSIIVNCRNHIAVQKFPTCTAFDVIVKAAKGLAMVKEDMKKRSFGHRGGFNPSSRKAYVIPEYVQILIPLVFGHRISLKSLVGEKLNLRSNREFLIHVIRNVPPPV